MLPGETITTCIIIYEPLTPPSCACIGSTGSRRSNSPSAVSNPKKIYRWTGRRRRRKIKLSTTRVLMIFERELESLLCPIRVNFYGNFREKLYSKFLKLVLPFQPSIIHWELEWENKTSMDGSRDIFRMLSRVHWNSIITWLEERRRGKS